MGRVTVHPDQLFNSTQYGFSQVVITDPGKLVFISGQTAWDAQEELIGGYNLESQTRQALSNLKIAIESAGGTLENIVMLRIYKVDYKPSDGKVISSLLKQTFGDENPPASTWISVHGLANPGFLIEIEAQAVL